MSPPSGSAVHTSACAAPPCVEKQPSGAALAWPPVPVAASCQGAPAASPRPSAAAAAGYSLQSSCLTFFSSLSTPLNRALGECCFLGLLAVGPFKGFLRLPFDDLPGLAILADMPSSSTWPSFPLCHHSPNRSDVLVRPSPSLINRQYVKLRWWGCLHAEVLLFPARQCD